MLYAWDLCCSLDSYSRYLAIRKLADIRSKVDWKLERRDIIAEYSNYGSSVYAPKARDGAFRDKAAMTLRVELDEIQTYRGM